MNLIFSLKRVIRPQYRQSEFFFPTIRQYLTHKFTNDDITKWKNLSLLVVSKHPTCPAPLPAPPRLRRYPGTYNPEFIFRDLLPAVPALSSFDFSIWTSRPDPVKTFRVPSVDAAKRQPNLGGIPPPVPNQYCGQTQPREYYAPEERAQWKPCLNQVKPGR